VTRPRTSRQIRAIFLMNVVGVSPESVTNQEQDMLSHIIEAEGKTCHCIVQEAPRCPIAHSVGPGPPVSESVRKR